MDHAESAPPESASDRKRLVAFGLRPATQPSLEIVPAARWRDWMNETNVRFANRCLPLLMANEAGWLLLNPYGFEADWSGADDPGAITITPDGSPVPPWRCVHSNFGYGILTWAVPYLFRTPDGYNTLARGPANLPKDGISALEGLVETDWSTATFTMNWKFTRPGRVRFERDEPFCMIVPQRRGELESFTPEIRPVDAEPEVARGYREWDAGRDELRRRKFLGMYFQEHADDADGWEKAYFRGRTSDGRQAAGHQTKLRLLPFRRG